MLKVRLIRFENVVLMKVLEQMDIERGGGDVFKYGDMVICSASTLQLRDDTIFIRGNDASRDDKFVTIDFSNAVRATEYFAKVKRTIEAYNASCTGQEEHKQEFDEDIVIGG